jgi:hypothetical protein
MAGAPPRAHTTAPTQAGQETYKALTRQYYRDADACLVVFGV